MWKNGRGAWIVWMTLASPPVLSMPPGAGTCVQAAEDLSDQGQYNWAQEALSQLYQRGAISVSSAPGSLLLGKTLYHVTDPRQVEGVYQGPRDVGHAASRAGPGLYFSADKEMSRVRATLQPGATTVQAQINPYSPLVVGKFRFTRDPKSNLAEGLISMRSLTGEEKEFLTQNFDVLEVAPPGDGAADAQHTDFVFHERAGRNALLFPEPPEKIERLMTLLSQEQTDPTELLDLLSENAVLRDIFDDPTGLGRLTVREHTGDVLKSHAQQAALHDFQSMEVPGVRLQATFTIALSLHDARKAEGGSDKTKQHEASVSVMQKIMAERGFRDQEIRLASAVVGNGFIGDLIVNKRTPASMKAKIDRIANQLEIDPRTLFRMSSYYYCVDAGSYPHLRMQKNLFTEKEGKIEIADPSWRALRDLYL